MKELYYPAVFHKGDKGFWVSFPDLPECLTEGDNMEQAYEMAVDALGLALTSRKEEGQEIPIAFRANDVKNDDGIIVLVKI